MGLRLFFRMRFQQEAFRSCMHDRRGMCPEIIFIPKKEFWLWDFLGKSLYDIFPHDTCGLFGTFVHKHIQFKPNHPVGFYLLLFL